MGKPNHPSKIVVHHTAYATHALQFETVNNLHRQRFDFVSSLGWYVGYHYLVEWDGSIRQARDDEEEGAHVIGQNTQSIGIALAGNFDLETPSASQRVALVQLIDKLLFKFNIPANEIYPHRAFTQTKCYGIMLGDDWARITYQQFVKKKLAYYLDLLKALLQSLKTYVY